MYRAYLRELRRRDEQRLSTSPLHKNSSNNNLNPQVDSTISIASNRTGGKKKENAPLIISKDIERNQLYDTENVYIFVVLGASVSPLKVDNVNFDVSMLHCFFKDSFILI